MSQEVALGIYLSHSFESEALLQVIAKEHTVFLTAESCLFKITLHDDIVLDKSEDREVEILEDELGNMDTCFRRNPKIKIGRTNFCTNMIYLNTQDPREKTPTVIDEVAIADLLVWKRELIEQGRLNPDAKLQLAGNCCS